MRDNRQQAISGEERFDARLILDPVKARDFILGGNAYFTILSLKTRTYLTYRVKRAGVLTLEGELYYVRTLTKPATYTLLGTIRGTTFRVLAKQEYKLSTAPHKLAFEWFWRHLSEKALIPPQVELRHDGRCCRCGRQLTTPESIDLGIGPECIKRKK